MSNNRVCHFKLVLLGDSAVGKSCLVVRFVRDEFFEFQEPTIGGMGDIMISMSSLSLLFTTCFTDLHSSHKNSITAYSCVFDTNCCIGRRYCKVWNLGYSWTGKIQKLSSYVLSVTHSFCSFFIEWIFFIIYFVSLCWVDTILRWNFAFLTSSFLIQP